MKPSISVLTLGVGNLERALAFYRDGLGLPTQGIVGTEFAGGAVAFFRLEGGLILALWPQESLARETGLEAGEPAFRAADLSIGTALPPARRPIARSPRPRWWGTDQSIPASIASGAGTRGTSKIRTGISGRSTGTRMWRSSRNRRPACGGVGAHGADAPWPGAPTLAGY